VFSFGVVLWELWTSKEPYDGLNYHALLHQLTSSEASIRPCLPGSPDWDPAVGPEPVAGYRSLMERCWSVRLSSLFILWASFSSGVTPPLLLSANGKCTSTRPPPPFCGSGVIRVEVSMDGFMGKSRDQVQHSLSRCTLQAPRHSC